MAVCYSFTVAIGNGYKDGERKWDFVHNFVIITLGADFFFITISTFIKTENRTQITSLFLASDLTMK